MRNCSIITTLVALNALGSLAHGQNDYVVPGGGGAFTDPNWVTGGPTTWGGDDNTEVDGSIAFDTTGLAGSILVNGIDLDYSGITGLTTSGSVNAVQLILEGSGSLSFHNGGDEILINPADGLTLRIETFFDGDVHLDTSNMEDGSIEELLVESTMEVTGSNLRVTGDNEVNFAEGSELTMDGTITVGSSTERGLLGFESAESINGEMGLVITGPTSAAPGQPFRSTVRLGSADIEEDQEFVFHGLSGNGLLQTIRGVDSGDPTISYDANVTITGGGHSMFEGSLAIGGDFTVDGQGTYFEYMQQDQSGDYTLQTERLIEGEINVTDGATFIVGRFELDLGGGATIAIPSLTFESLNISGGGMFGGDAWIILSSDVAFGNLLNISDGWLVGGDFEGQGQLRIEGQGFYSFFGPNAGFMITVNSDDFNDETSYITWDSLSYAGLLGGVNLHVNLIGEQYLSTLQQFTMLQTTALLPDGEINEGILSTSNTAEGFDTSTSRVTRFIEIVDNFNEAAGLFQFTTSQLQITLGANYAAPAGDLEGLGNTLNGLIAGADEAAGSLDPENHPNYWMMELLGQLDSYAMTEASYQQALSWMLPTTQFVADRATAENRFFDVQRNNLRELAIGSRAPGMIKAINPMPFLAGQEQDSVDAAVEASQHPQVIINTTSGAKSSDSSIFQSLYVDGYGGRNAMEGVSFVPGYDNDTYGVEAGWGIALNDGITVGVSAGWERAGITLNNNLGNMDLDSIRAAPFLSWSGLAGNVEQYAIISAGGGYNYGSGTRRNAFGDDRTVELHGWEFDITGAVGTRVPLGETIALQPEASLRYSLVHYDGTETQGGSSYDYAGDDFQYANSRLGVGFEWFGTPELRTTTKVGYQAQYYNWGSATWTLPQGQATASQSAGSGTINQVYVGLELEWAPDWNTAVRIGYDGAFGESTQNSIRGGFLIRF
jgi:hypothetical protein